jgi:hypothetical protein
MSLFAPTLDGRGALPFSKVCPTARKMAERPSLKKAIDVAESSGISLMKTASVAQTKVPHSTSKERRLSLSSSERRNAPSPALSLGTPLIRTSESSSRSDASSVSLSSGLPLRT